MVGYDFDKTIYDGDSTIDFFFFMLKKRPYLIFLSPYFLFIFICFGLKILGKKRFKELAFFYLPKMKNKERLVDEFWQCHANKILKWYCYQKDKDDVIVSASLEFILKPVADMLGIKNLIATKYNLETGKIDGENCYGEEKVNRFSSSFKNAKLDSFYSDSMSDLPMMKISSKAFLVKNKTPKEISVG